MEKFICPKTRWKTFTCIEVWNQRSDGIIDAPFDCTVWPIYLWNKRCNICSLRKKVNLSKIQFVETPWVKVVRSLIFHSIFDQSFWCIFAVMSFIGWPILSRGLSFRKQAYRLDRLPHTNIFDRIFNKSQRTRWV